MNKKYNPPMQNHSGQFAADAMREPHVTLLDHFAGLAMQSMLITIPNQPVLTISKTAYTIADAMLKARKEVSGE